MIAFTTQAATLQTKNSRLTTAEAKGHLNVALSNAKYESKDAIKHGWVDPGIPQNIKPFELPWELLEALAKGMTVSATTIPGLLKPDSAKTDLARLESLATFASTDTIFLDPLVDVAFDGMYKPYTGGEVNIINTYITYT